MRAGGGKKKGAQFERVICKRLSLWITDGKREDVFWRSAMSGGRATVSKGAVRQCGDVCANSAEGYDFSSKWFIECKHVKKLDLESFLFKRIGRLAKFWTKACKEAEKYGRDPMIICQQNGWPVLVVTHPNHLAHFAYSIVECSHAHLYWFEDWVAQKR